MKTKLAYLILLVVLTCSACKNNNVYSDLLKEERKLIESYIQRQGITVVTEDLEGNRSSFSVSIAVIYSNPVSYEMMNGNIGYVKLENFDGRKQAMEYHLIGLE